jgi:hypothetical protein
MFRSILHLIFYISKKPKFDSGYCTVQTPGALYYDLAIFLCSTYLLKIDRICYTPQDMCCHDVVGEGEEAEGGELAGEVGQDLHKTNIKFDYVKGQGQEMVFEQKPWNSRLGLKQYYTVLYCI